MYMSEWYDDGEPYMGRFRESDILPQCGAPAAEIAEEKRRDYLNGCPDCGFVGR